MRLSDRLESAGLQAALGVAAQHTSNRSGRMLAENRRRHVAAGAMWLPAPSVQTNRTRSLAIVRLVLIEVLPRSTDRAASHPRPHLRGKLDEPSLKGRACCPIFDGAIERDDCEA